MDEISHPRLGWFGFTESNLFAANIRGLAEKVSLHVNQDLNALYPKLWPSRVSVYYSDGTITTRDTESPKGDPENPASEQELIDKFLDLAQKVITVQQAEATVAEIMKLESVEKVSTIFS